MIKLKNKLRLAWQWIAGEFLMIWQWITGFYYAFICPKLRIRIFQGYGHYWLARKYADRRTKNTRVNKVCGGKRHYVLAWGDVSLIVLNRLELTGLQNKGIIRKGININEILKHAYYLSK